PGGTKSAMQGAAHGASGGARVILRCASAPVNPRGNAGDPHEHQERVTRPPPASVASRSRRFLLAPRGPRRRPARFPRKRVVPPQGGRTAAEKGASSLSRYVARQPVVRALPFRRAGRSPPSAGAGSGNPRAGSPPSRPRCPRTLALTWPTV